MEKWISELLVDQQKVSERQVRILEAAIESFSEKGYASTSTSEIAKRAGVAEGTIFRHYKTKKDLLLAIVGPTMSKVVAPFMAKNFVDEILKDEYYSAEQFIRAIAANRYEFVKKNTPMIKIFLQEIAFHDDIRENFKPVFQELIYKRIAPIMAHFRECGEIRNLPDATIIRLVSSTLISFFITRFIVIPEHPWDDEKELEDTIQFIMRGLRNETADQKD
ncbi:TetR/AcrR family transcriptional regulator [Bacillus salinus]|uniref:TetR/AcrR family transcriptional regulator n=1 Tax=Bacillus sp. HMF5848 TaxID=2495421 RepID=UPI0021ADDF7E|nr:TetR/AcrR family transcriptional regulator [Bacillus sp. HMF5848]